MHALSLRAGPAAYRLLQERGLRADDVDVIPAASGGPKWLAIAGLDRFLFSGFLSAPRTRPLHLIGSSIGSWRMACLAQRDPLAALNRAHHAYIHDQSYTPHPAAREVTAVLNAVLATLLGEHGITEILVHPTMRLHVITSQGRGLAGATPRASLAVALTLASAMNVVSRRTLGLQFRRVIFATDVHASPFRHLHDLPTTHVALTASNLRDALAASGSIPMAINGVAIPDAPGGLHLDGGVTDYHLDLDYSHAARDGLMLYPHFYSSVIPGWFDKSLPWRRAAPRNFTRALLLSPTDEWVATLPGGRIPDRRDFAAMPEQQRVRVWEEVNRASTALGDELGELIATGKLAQRVSVWS
jgi:hypothetical protein